MIVVHHPTLGVQCVRIKGDLYLVSHDLSHILVVTLVNHRFLFMSVMMLVIY